MCYIKTQHIIPIEDGRVIAYREAKVSTHMGVILQKALIRFDSIRLLPRSQLSSIYMHDGCYIYGCIVVAKCSHETIITWCFLIHHNIKIILFFVYFLASCSTSQATRILAVRYLLHTAMIPPFQRATSIKSITKQIHQCYRPSAKT